MDRAPSRLGAPSTRALYESCTLNLVGLPNRIILFIAYFSYSKKTTSDNIKIDHRDRHQLNLLLRAVSNLELNRCFIFPKRVRMGSHKFAASLTVGSHVFVPSIVYFILSRRGRETLECLVSMVPRSTVPPDILCP